MKKINFLLQFNGPVHDFESQGNIHVVEEERDNDSCQSDDTEEDSNDETAAIVETKDKHTRDDEGGADLDTIPEGVDLETQAEEYSGKSSYMKVFDRTKKNSGAITQ